MISRGRRPVGLGLGVLALVLALIGAMAAGWNRARRLRAELDRAQESIAAGRWATARRDLAELAQRWPADGELLFLLGLCEEAQGMSARALAAWEKIPVRDAFYPRAAESRASVLMNLGRFAPAESCLIEALEAAPAADRYPLLHALSRLFRLEGRSREVSEAFVAAWIGAPDPGELLQDLWKNDSEPVPVDGWHVLLDAADSHDERVWLGRARYSILVDKLEDAASWLARCQSRRPDDLAVWKARLDLAMAAQDGAALWEAAGRIPAEALRPEEIADVRAWLAERIGDPQARRRESARLVEVQPLRTDALEHLVDLAREAGDLDEAGRLRQRKAEVDRARDRIHKLVALRIDFRDHAQEVAELSAILGRSFDHHAWSLVAAGRSAGQPRLSEGAGAVAGTDADLSRSTATCRAMAQAALGRLLRTSEQTQLPGAGSLADQLADLRVASERRHLLTGAGEDRLGPAPTDVRFVDDAATARLEFVFNSGKTPQRFLPETMSGGLALLDFDGDGWLDVYCVQGGAVAPSTEGGGADPGGGDRLFRNRRDGTFEDATATARIAPAAGRLEYGMGVAVGDYDNDGDPDLFLTRLHQYVLLRNRGDGTFEDGTEAAGLAGDRDNPTSAAFADLDGDGDLDLYVCHYVRWDPGHPVLCPNDSGGYNYCDPAKYERAADHVFRNDGGRLVDVTGPAGFIDPDGRGLGVVAADLDDDRRVDLFVTNDGTANFLFRNLGGFRFEETALTAGVAGGAAGGYQAGMGVAAADLDGDGRLDLLVTNFYGEGTTLHHNVGNGLFTDRSTASGILPASRYLLGFGIAVFDAANAGRRYVAIANGHVNDLRPYYPYAMPARLYERRSAGRLVDVSDRSGPPWTLPRLGRGLAAGDLDNDGRPDLLVVSQDGPLAFFHNRTDRPGHFATFRLRGTTSNRDGIGARIVVSAAGQRHVSQRVGGGSYLAASDDRLHFGLGESTSIDAVEVAWPSGRIDRWTNLAADTGYLLVEGDPAVLPLAGFSRPQGRKARADRAAPDPPRPPGVVDSVHRAGGLSRSAARREAPRRRTGTGAGEGRPGRL
jgi:tetratricopeptide (TPR) repeat protein